jgi:hypothetical protein
MERTFWHTFQGHVEASVPYGKENILAYISRENNFKKKKKSHTIVYKFGDKRSLLGNRDPSLNS